MADPQEGEEREQPTEGLTTTFSIPDMSEFMSELEQVSTESVHRAAIILLIYLFI